jgi:hypothetical protein
MPVHCLALSRDGKQITALVRYEMVTDKPADSLPLSRREGHGSYPPTRKGEAEGVLTWRMRETDRRVVIPRGQWSLGVCAGPSAEDTRWGDGPQRLAVFSLRPARTFADLTDQPASTVSPAVTFPEEGLLSPLARRSRLLLRWWLWWP